MTDDLPESDRLWEVGWEGHDHAQRRRLARLTLAEKLAWLESTQRVVASLARARERQRRAGGGPAAQPPGPEAPR